MAIRLRHVAGKLVAICAARSVAKPDDVYLDDAAHHALASKFSRDYHEMYGYEFPYQDDGVDLVEREENNNSARDWWDDFYG